MKLDRPKLDRVLKSPDSIGALLFYGPDEGLAHEYAAAAQKAVLGAGDDPFRLAELTPDEIIREYGDRDPAKNYLVQIIGAQKESYQGKGQIPIKMHNGMRFQIICVGPMTVSDGRS
jgi:hypothetical protein